MDLFYEEGLPQRIVPAYSLEKSPVSICFASNNKYAPYLMIVIYSLLVNADEERSYDILIMTKDISKENREEIQRLSKLKKETSIRFLPMKTIDDEVDVSINRYYSTETNYRLYLLSDHFQLYKKILYLDCDMIIQGDISSLYDTDMQEYPVAAVQDVMFEVMYQIKNPLFYHNVPYNALGYFKTVIGLETLNQYFNAGVLLLDLERMRKLSDDRKAISLLQKNEFTYNDQDTLNYIVKGNYFLLDTSWNYQNAYENVRSMAKEVLRKQFQWMFRDNPKIIHYVSGKKPWNTKNIPLEDIFHKYEQEFNKYRKEKIK